MDENQAIYSKGINTNVENLSRNMTATNSYKRANMQMT
jgi:hypothetical protein